MGRKKRIVKSDDDGTPLEIVEVDDETVEADPIVEPDAPVEPEPDPQNAAVEGAEAVVWTALGAERGAFSEHGQHAEGETVLTVHADALISSGFAKRTGE